MDEELKNFTLTELAEAESAIQQEKFRRNFLFETPTVIGQHIDRYKELGGDMDALETEVLKHF